MNKNPRLFKSILAAAYILIMPLVFFVGCASQDNVAEDTPSFEQQEHIDSAINWLVTNNQNPDGGYGIDFDSGNPASNVSSTLDAILAIASADYNLEEHALFQESSPIGYLNDNRVELTAFAEGAGGSNGKVVLALAKANQDPRSFGGEDWVSMLTKQYMTSGEYNTADAFNQSLAVLALKIVDEPVPEQAISWLIGKQADDGSWDDGFGTAMNSDATAMAIMALVSSGSAVDQEPVAKAIQFLRSTQLATGGWEYGPGFGENANSTALVIQALSAVGDDFSSQESSWVVNDLSPMDVLLSWQGSSGAFQADFGQGPFDDFFATVQSIPALTGHSLP